jgi:hypothetical protein
MQGIQGLRKKMATLEERVHRVHREHSRLPAPTTTPPRASPRADRDIPASVTMRSSRKRPSASHASTPSASEGTASRLSFGFNPGASVNGDASRPSSRASISGAAGLPRPSSRTSGVASIPRPPSQSSLRTPSSLGYYPQNDRMPRPRSSMSGSYALNKDVNPNLPSRAGTPSGSRHGYSQSMADTSLLEDTEGEGTGDGGITPTARRSSGIPNLGRRQSATLVRRQSNISQAEIRPGSSASVRPESSAANGRPGSSSGLNGRPVSRGGGGNMLPPARRERKTGVDVGETF